MTGKQRMMQAIGFQQPDRPPHFEAMFELEREAFGMEFPDRRLWATCSAAEKQRMIAACMAIYERIVDRFKWDALAVFSPWSDPDGVRAAKATFGDDILIGSIVGHGVWAIEVVQDWMQFATDLFERPDRIHEQAERMCREALGRVDALADAGADFIFIASDVAFNAGPFISPPQFAEFVTPYLARIVQRVRQRGCIAFFHSDGMLMPVLEDILATQPHVLHSIDPMAGMDIAQVKQRTYGRAALMGNVQCNLLQDGPRERIRESALYCLQHGSPGGGYIYSTSNTIFPGMPLEHYQHMLQVYWEFCGCRPPAQACRP